MMLTGAVVGILQHGADPAGGENFQQQRMSLAAINDVNFTHPPVERRQTSLDFGDHPVADLPRSDHRASLIGRHRFDNRIGVIPIGPHAVNVRQKHQFLSAERLGDRHRRGIRVDVVNLARIIDAERGNDGHLIGVRQAFDHVAIDRGDVADEPQIAFGFGRFGVNPFFTAEHRGGVGRQVHRPPADSFNRLGDLLVELPAEDVTHNLQRRGIGDPSTADELRRDVLRLQRPRDRFAAAVNDDRFAPDRFHKNDVEQQVMQRRVVIEQTATEFDDGGFAAKATDPPHRLDQRVGFGGGRVQWRFPSKSGAD